MTVKSIFDGIAEAFRQYQAEIEEKAQASDNPAPAGLEPETEAEKTEKKMTTEKRVEQDFPKRERLRSIWQNTQFGVSR